MYFYELHVRGPHNNITHNITFKLKYQPENRREDDALILICQDVNVKFWDFCPADVFILKSAETRRDARCRPVDRKYVQISLSALTISQNVFGNIGHQDIGKNSISCISVYYYSFKKRLLRVEKVYYRGIIVHSNIYFLRNEVHFPSKETNLNR